MVTFIWREPRDPSKDERNRRRRERRHQREREARATANAALLAARLATPPFKLAQEDYPSWRAAFDHYNARPPDPCPWPKGTPEEREYERGWQQAIKRGSREA